ncbi:MULTISPECIES: helix-turn-helix transcriptional regulator [Acinetobacter]|uniref:helix-turn-helix transcriptional regulator n=1 Tax=Acinetobacter TaxID=469 RepID=UPI00225B6975|nr:MULTISPECIES: hypothetical protein [Acinetobacter]MCX3006059.1 hypothetical protein [Acinetobacter baumannii]MDE4040561.1 hypothetical protein [Acinetobacter pittii]MDS7965628.1 hypothetical protein [Acinetobacter sp. V117_2]
MNQVEQLAKYNHQHLPKLRLTMNEVCEMLNVSRDKLSKMEREDPTFPRSWKDGSSRQAARFYDYREVLEWYEKDKEKKRNLYS